MSAAARAALVTGGAQGIGRGIAELLVARGYGVVLADVDREAGEATAAALAARGRVLFVETDVADEPAVAACVATAMRSFGRLDALVNNAGIAAPHRGPVEELALEAWNRMLAVNLTGAFLLTKHAAAHLRAARGAIVNIASTRCLQSEPDTEAYAASKGALVALTHALAISLGPDVRVNCVSPGWIDVSATSRRKQGPALRPEDHAQHPVGRVGVPQDVAALVAWLLSDEAGFVTGQNFVTDGGMTKKMIYLD
ncbi:MAG TPA: glucose 1-dehydrogenase [Pelomicrobium sp.]|nr:glucose 1-dehydrogenase [Pelomicrobium sp.]